MNKIFIIFLFSLFVLGCSLKPVSNELKTYSNNKLETYSGDYKTQIGMFVFDGRFF